MAPHWWGNLVGIAQSRSVRRLLDLSKVLVRLHNHMNIQDIPELKDWLGG
jgi:hypothetical protein